MRILIIQPRVSYYVGGGEKIPLKHAEYLSGGKNEVHIFTIEPPFGKYSFLYEELKKKTLNINIKEFKIPDKFKKIYEISAGESRERWDIESLLFSNLIREEVDRLRPDVIMSYYILDGLFKPLNTKNILYLLGYPDDKNPLRKTFLSFYDKVISISKNTQNKWKDEVAELARGPILHTAVDIPNIDNIKKQKLDGVKNIVFAGRLIERKGLETLLTSFISMSDLKYTVNLYILGEGPLLSKLKKMSLSIKGNNKIFFIGSTPLINEYFAAADICVFPSYEKEGLMGVVMEAMAIGCAVITTTNNGNEELILDGVNGLLVEPRNEESLKKAMVLLLENNELRNRLRSRALEHAKNNFSWANNIEHLEKILNE